MDELLVVLWDFDERLMIRLQPCELSEDFLPLGAPESLSGADLSPSPLPPKLQHSAPR
jgi:hypothetical protein